LDNGESVVEILIFLLVGITITTVASQFERARRNSAELAESLATERARLEAIIETVPDALSIHDAQGKIVQLNRAGRQNVGFYRGKETLAEAQSAYSVRMLTGKLLPVEEFPVARALHGETVSNAELR